MAKHPQWSESLFGCFGDCGICLYGCCCTPCLFGENAKKIDKSSCCLMCCAYTILSSCYICWIPHCMKRKILRQKYNLPEDCCGDFAATCCCGPCTICQEARFLKHRDERSGVAIRVVIASNIEPTINQPH